MVQVAERVELQVVVQMVLQVVKAADHIRFILHAQLIFCVNISAGYSHSAAAEGLNHFIWFGFMWVMRLRCDWLRLYFLITIRSEPITAGGDALTV